MCCTVGPCWLFILNIVVCICRRRKWQPAPVFLPGKFHGQKSLAGYSPWGSQRAWHDLATFTFGISQVNRELFKELDENISHRKSPLLPVTETVLLIARKGLQMGQKLGRIFLCDLPAVSSGEYQQGISIHSDFICKILVAVRLVAK